MPVRVYAIEAVKGVMLFWAFFFLLGFIAFVPFGRDSNGYVILAVWLLVSSFVWVWLRRNGFVTRRTVFFMAAMLLVLVGLYFVPMRRNMPAEAEEMNESISADHEDRYEYARDLFYSLIGRWEAPTRQYLLEPHKVFFIRDFAYFWERQGEYADSNKQSLMYKVMLLESGRFAEDEVWLEYSGCVMSPHTIVAITRNGEAVRADLWAAEHFDEYEFGMYATVPCTRLQGDAMNG